METLTDIWAELRTRVRRFVGKSVNDTHTADDITQDVMLKLQTRLDTLLPEDKLPAWTIAVARNAIIDHYRARAVRDHANLADIEPSAQTTDAETDTAIRELTPCLLRMVEQLPQPYRDAMKLVDFEGLSQQELAGRLGVSPSGAKSRVQGRGGSCGICSWIAATSRRTAGGTWWISRGPSGPPVTVAKTKASPGAAGERFCVFPEGRPSPRLNGRDGRGAHLRRTSHEHHDRPIHTPAGRLLRADLLRKHRSRASRRRRGETRAELR